MDHHCFLRRAVELARPNGGRICLLLPEGLLSRDNRGLPELRATVADRCQLRAVISLPRVFKNNNARMAIVYLVRGFRRPNQRRVLVAEVREHWVNTDGNQQTTDIFGELEKVIDLYGGRR